MVTSCIHNHGVAQEQAPTMTITKQKELLAKQEQQNKMESKCRNLRNTGLQRQQGLALAISLVLLVAMTIVGIATLRSTRLNEKISSNAQQKAISFEAAESSIASMWNAEALLATLDEIPNGIFNNPDTVVPAGVADRLSEDFDQGGLFGKSVDITAGVNVQYCGEMNLPVGSGISADESKEQMVGVLFDVNGHADIEGSHARSNHIQRGYFERYKTGRTGKCTTPGT